MTGGPLALTVCRANIPSCRMGERIRRPAAGLRRDAVAPRRRKARPIRAKGEAGETMNLLRIRPTGSSIGGAT